MSRPSCSLRTKTLWLAEKRLVATAAATVGEGATANRNSSQPKNGNSSKCKPEREVGAKGLVGARGWDRE